jgi:hypothetical protein
MMMMAGLMIAAPACGEQFTTSMTVSAPSAPFATTEETVLTLAPILPAPEVVQRFIDHGVTHQDDNHALVLRDSQQGWANSVAMATPKTRGRTG